MRKAYVLDPQTNEVHWSGEAESLVDALNQCPVRDCCAMWEDLYNWTPKQSI